MQLKAKQLLDIDFLAAAGAVTYAGLVSSVEALAHFADVFASPEAAVGFAGLAIIRWAAKVRKAE